MAIVDWMIQARIQTQVGMAMTRHKNKSFYCHYDQTLELQKMVTVKKIVVASHDGMHIIYENVFHDLFVGDVAWELAWNNTFILLGINLDGNNAKDGNQSSC